MPTLSNLSPPLNTVETYRKRELFGGHEQLALGGFGRESVCGENARNQRELGESRINRIFLKTGRGLYFEKAQMAIKKMKNLIVRFFGLR